MTERFPHSLEIAGDTASDVGATEAIAPSNTVPLSAAGLPLTRNWLAIIAFIWIGQAVSMITSYAAVRY